MVPVVQVRKVRVTMTERLVLVGMAMRLPGGDPRTVGVPVVLVVDVRVRVLERLVLVFVVVPLGEVKPHPGGHEDRGEDGPPVEPVVERDR
jgi:hypothetical protein